MAGIPSTAIKFYTAASGGTEVTGGTSAGATIYPRLSNSFTENLTGLSKTITFPYVGRVAITGTKTFTAGGDADTFTLTLSAKGAAGAGYSGIFDQTEDARYIATVSYSGAGTPTIDNTDEAITVSIPKTAGNCTITVYSNNEKGNSAHTAGTGATFTSQTINGQTTVKDMVDVVVTNDPGRVTAYAIVLVFAVTQNTTMSTREVWTGDWNSDNLPTHQCSLIVTQAASTETLISLTPDNASIAATTTTGECSTQIVVAAETNWTIS
jgi:hypothetical protein